MQFFSSANRASTFRRAPCQIAKWGVSADAAVVGPLQHFAVAVGSIRWRVCQVRHFRAFEISEAADRTSL
jgi:hypothetical protein